MQATSAAPLPLPAAPPASPGAGSQASDPVASGVEGPEQQSPFAAVLGHQMKAAAGEGKRGHDAKVDVVAPTDVLAAGAAGEAPEDALAILATMLDGIVVPQAPVADARPADADLPADAAEAAATIPIAAPISAAVENVAAPAIGDETTPRSTESVDLAAPIDAKPAAKPETAILAATPASGKEASAENGKGSDGEFAAMLDAARSGGDGKTGANVSELASAPQSQALSAHVVHAPTAPHAAGGTPAQNVATPVGAPGWGHEVGEKVNWMVGRQESRAELILNPPELGRIEVSVTMKGDQATATFVSANPAVREALEDAMPHLREVLQGAGISLGQTQVGAESFQQSANAGENGDNSARGRPREDGNSPHDVAANDATSTRWVQRGNGLVDTFA